MRSIAEALEAMMPAFQTLGEEEVPVEEAALWLMSEVTGESIEQPSRRALLEQWRRIDRSR